MEINNVSKLPAANSGVNSGMGEKTDKFNDLKSQVTTPQVGQQPQVGLPVVGQPTNNGLANMFANTGQVVQNGNAQGQQGLAGSLGSYRSMWQPNGGNNYQVVGGVGNII